MSSVEKQLQPFFLSNLLKSINFASPTPNVDSDDTSGTRGDKLLYLLWVNIVSIRINVTENRRYLLRAATTGISGIIDPYGRILTQSKLMTQAMLTEKISPLTTLTPYAKHGDYFSFISLTLTLIFLILAVAAGAAAILLGMYRLLGVDIMKDLLRRRKKQ